MNKKIIFLTATRADFGKFKSLIRKVGGHDNFEVHIFVTGMHMLAKYGMTANEVDKAGFTNVYRYINQNRYDSMDCILAKTIQGLSDYVYEVKPDMIVVHGDRVEAMAGAIVGALNNILVSHIEGGEVSGTIDELIRHSVSKLSHLHFVSNEKAKTRLVQLGESKSSIYVIGSPDFDIMASVSLPSIEQVKSYYNITFDDYAVLLYHSVTTDLANLPLHIKHVVDGIVGTNDNFVVIYPNNDRGSDVIINEYQRLEGNEKCVIFPSVRFEYFLTLLKNSKYMIGNSSAGVREAPFYGLPSINLGSRQNNRSVAKSIIHLSEDSNEIIENVDVVGERTFLKSTEFGIGNSDELFLDIITKEDVWKTNRQKLFVDLWL